MAVKVRDATGRGRILPACRAFHPMVQQYLLATAIETSCKGKSLIMRRIKD